MKLNVHKPVLTCVLTFHATLTFTKAEHKAAAESELGDSCVGSIIPTALYCHAHIFCGRHTANFEFSETEKLRHVIGKTHA